MNSISAAQLPSLFYSTGMMTLSYALDPVISVAARRLGRELRDIAVIEGLEAAQRQDLEDAMYIPDVRRRVAHIDGMARREVWQGPPADKNEHTVSVLRVGSNDRHEMPTLRQYYLFCDTVPSPLVVATALGVRPVQLSEMVDEQGWARMCLEVSARKQVMKNVVQLLPWVQAAVESAPEIAQRLRRSALSHMLAAEVRFARTGAPMDEAFAASLWEYLMYPGWDLVQFHQTGLIEQMSKLEPLLRAHTHPEGPPRRPS